METLTIKLAGIYDRFEAAAAPYKRDAACRKGCAYCCSQAGAIDITTLEGWAMLDVIATFPLPLRKTVQKAIKKDMARREKGFSSPCPFLDATHGCRVYDIRPFSCRRIYSVHACDASHPPMLSRSVMALGDSAIRQLQSLDDTGYSGHLSYILHLFKTPDFQKIYQTGEFRPQDIASFGKAHAIRINRFMK